MEMLADFGFWLSLFAVTLVQVALGADNLIIVTIIAGKLPDTERDKAVRWGLIIAMLLRILLLFTISLVLRYATQSLLHIEHQVFGKEVIGDVTVKALILFVGGFFLIWKGIKELRVKAKGAEHAVQQASSLSSVIAVIVGINLLFSVDSILTVVGMTDKFPIMVASVLISVGLMLLFAKTIADYIRQNPDFEILGLFVLLLIGFVLMLEAGHVAHMTIDGEGFPYIPQWIVIFILLLMFATDLFQNWVDRNEPAPPVRLHRRKR